MIDAIPVGVKSSLPIRVHVVGDCATPSSATIIGRAMVRYQKVHSQRAWTYTHAWSVVGRKKWMDASVLASIEDPDQVAKARAQGYEACAMTVDRHTSGKVWLDKHGNKWVPCPNQINPAVDCVKCKLCLDSQRLGRLELNIAFAAHGSSSKKLNKFQLPMI